MQWALTVVSILHFVTEVSIYVCVYIYIYVCILEPRAQALSWGAVIKAPWLSWVSMCTSKQRFLCMYRSGER